MGHSRMMTLYAPARGFYRPLETPLHRLDVRPKLFLTCLVIALGFATGSSLFSLGSILLLFFILKSSGISRGELLILATPMLFGTMFTVGFHVLFGVREGAVIASVAGLEFYSGGIEQGVYYSLRLILFITALAVVTFTTSPSDLASVVPWLLAPFGKLRVPVNDIGLICHLAVRFIPILFEEYAHIRMAQSIRGVELRGSIVSRIRQSVWILGPVFTATLTRSDEIAVAVSARGYRGDRPRTHFTKARFDKTGLAVICLAAAFMSLLFLYTDGTHG